MSSMSRSSSGGLRRSVSRLNEQQRQAVDQVSVARTTPDTEQQQAVTGQRRSSSIVSVVSSGRDSGDRMSAARQRSSSSLFSSEDNVDVGLTSHRTSAASTDRQSTSSNGRTSLFRLPFPKRAGRRSSSMSTAPSVPSPPQRTSRSDLYFSNT